MLSGARTRPRLQQASSAPLHAQFTGQPPPPRLYTRHPAQLGPVHSSPEAPQDSSRQDTRGLTSSPCEPHCIWRESSSSSAGEQPVGLGGPDHRRHTCRRVSLSTCGLAGPHPPRRGPCQTWGWGSIRGGGRAGFRDLPRPGQSLASRSPS